MNLDTTHPDNQPARRPRIARRETDSADTLFVVDEISPGLGPAYGGANVIMQLANLGVAYGVMESKVDSGNLHKHPVKRARTTLTYLAVALAGTARDRRIYREAVNAVHTQVRSDSDSPVAYNAFDPALQLWVASCLAMAVEDSRMLRRGRSVHDPETVYRASSVFATTLQVPPAMWPADREAFHRYRNEQLDRLEFDDRSREFLIGIARLDFLPRGVQLLFGRVNLFLTLGWLPPQLREKLGFTWTAADQRRFERWLTAGRVIDRVVPRTVVRAGWTAFVWDMRLRYATGATVV